MPSRPARTVSATVTTTIAVARPPLFAWFIPIELPRILTGWGPIPAVTATSGQTGPWDTPGSSRRVELGDGSTARERVTDCRAPAYFAYVVEDFTNPIRLLASEGRGRWWFDPAPGAPDATHVTWSYTFTARSRAAALVLAPVVRIAWRGFMRRGLDRLATLARAEAAAPTPSR